MPCWYFLPAPPNILKGTKMPNTDEHGNKITAKKEKKTIVSRQIRERRLMNSSTRSSKICGECGFHIRSEKHSEGGQHNNSVPVCHRGR